MSNPNFSRMNKAEIAAWAAERGAVISTELTKDLMIAEAERLATPDAPAARDEPAADAVEVAVAPPAQPAPVESASGTVSVKVTAYHITGGPTLVVRGKPRRFPLGEWCHDVPRNALSALDETAGLTFETKE